MALMGNLRKILSGKHHEADQNLAEESPHIESVEGTQAHRLADAFKKANPGRSDSVETCEGGQLEAIEPKVMPPSQVTPEDIQKASEDLTSHIESLKQQLAFQTGHFDEISQRLVRLEDAIRTAGDADPKLHDIARDLAALKSAQKQASEILQHQVKQIGDASTHHNGRLAEVQQHQDLQGENIRELGSNLAILHDANESLVKSNADTARQIDDRIEQLVLRESTINDAMKIMKRLALIAAIGAGLAAVLSLVSLLT